MVEVSIIFPIYNSETYLPRCLASIKARTLLRILKIILIDYSSSDQSGIIADEAARGDQRIRVIHQQNRGVSETRNDSMVGIGERLQREERCVFFLCNIRLGNPGSARRVSTIPTLTHFTAFRDQINNHSWIELAFSQEPETAELALMVTASGTFLYDLEDAEEIAGQENAYKLDTGVTLPYDTVLTLGATSTDLAGNVGFATKQATVSLSSPR